MFLDACAIISLMTDEHTKPVYEARLGQATSPCTSALAAWEAIIVLSRPEKLNRPYGIVEQAVVLWLELRGIELRQSDSPRETLSLAIAVAQKHGVSRRSLSSFDCFHYAYAKALRQPLLTLDATLLTTDAV